jgi:hypothetical protein
LLVGLSNPVNAQPSTIFTTVDENCHGTLNGFTGLQSLPCAFLTDPGPGGLASVMNYGLLSPPNLVTGDIVIRETPSVNSDIIRFSTVGSGSLFFYSDLDGGVDTPADVGLPGGLNTNVLFFNEVSIGAAGFGLIYTPTAGQPGFVGGATVPVQYTFISDAAAVPEPSSFVPVALSAGIGAMIFLRRRYRLRRTI